MNDVVPTEKVAPTYKAGQYWINEFSRQPLAFVLRANEFGVLLQLAFSETAMEDPIMDYPAGQTLMTHKGFEQYLYLSRAFEITDKLSEAVVANAIGLFEKAVASGDIPLPRRLPDTQAEIEALDEETYYTYIIKIPIPPMEYREVRGLHWLKTGSAGNLYTLREWNPEKRGWVMVDGNTDPTATLGFGVKEWYSAAHLYASSSSELSDVDALKELTRFLEGKSYMLDRKTGKRIFSTLRELRGSEDTTHPAYTFAIQPMQEENISVQLAVSVSGTLLRVFTLAVENGEYINDFV